MVLDVALTGENQARYSRWLTCQRISVSRWRAYMAFAGLATRYNARSRPAGRRPIRADPANWRPIRF